MHGSHGVAATISYALLGASMLTAACKDDSIGAEDAPSRAADTFCGSHYDCGCPQYQQVYTSEEQCRSEIEARVQGTIDEGEAAALAYNGACVKTFLDFFDSLGCRTSSELTSEETLEAYGAIRCKWFNGTMQAGQPCMELQNAIGDNCVEGLICEEGICIQEMEIPGPGDPCTGQASPCLGEALCFDLDEDGTFVCEPLPGENVTCLSAADLCADGLTCRQFDKLCVPAPGAGAECAAPGTGSRCAEGLECNPTSNVCEPAPTGGQPCTLTCAAGFTCQAGACAAEPPAVCSIAPAGTAQAVADGPLADLFGG